MAPEEGIDFALRVLAAEGLAGWAVDVSHVDGYCWRNQKRLDIGDGTSLGLILHETAHALARPRFGDQHGGMWASVFTRLVTNYCVPGE